MNNLKSLVFLGLVLASFSAQAQESVGCYKFDGSYRATDLMPQEFCITQMKPFIDPEGRLSAVEIESSLGNFKVTDPDLKKTERFTQTYSIEIFKKDYSAGSCDTYEIGTISLELDVNSSKEQILAERIVAKFKQTNDNCHSQPSPYFVQYIKTK